MRLALQLIEWSPIDREKLSHSLSNLDKLKLCQECFIYSDHDICEICRHPRRGELKSICVVENINDLLAIERSEQYHGYYHILGGVLNPLMNIGPEHLRTEPFTKKG